MILQYLNQKICFEMVPAKYRQLFSVPQRVKLFFYAVDFRPNVSSMGCMMLHYVLLKFDPVCVRMTHKVW